MSKSYRMNGFGKGTALQATEILSRQTYGAAEGRTLSELQPPIRRFSAGCSTVPLRANGQVASRHRGAGLVLKRILQAGLLVASVLIFAGAGDDSARFNDLGHRLMCACGCRQILLECNHVGCSYSDRMRAELVAAVDRGDNDDLTLQSFVQKYGPTVLAAPTKTGFDRVAWITPYLALLLGLVLVAFIVRAWRSRPLLLPADMPAPVHGAELDQFREQARKETEV